MIELYLVGKTVQLSIKENFIQIKKEDEKTALFFGMLRLFV